MTQTVCLHHKRSNNFAAPFLALRNLLSLQLIGRPNRTSRDRSPSDHHAVLRTADDSPPIKGSGGNSDGGGINGARPPVLTPPPLSSPKLTISGGSSDGGGGGGRGGGDIKGAPPPVLTPPPVPSLRLIPPPSEFGSVKRSINSWTKGQLLGSGSFGTVYEGMSYDGFFFAVKEVSLLDQGSNANQCIIQLEQEIALLSQFKHDNIVQYFGSHKEEAKLYIFLELMSHGSLASLYQRYHLQDSQVSAYTRQILSGLKYLHDKKVVHRDIKCANILVRSNGSVKLADFGLAKEITKLNGPKSCKGSVYWMAPEVVNPKSSYGPAADIWSLGCTVLEMLTRQVPYPNLDWPQAFFKIGQGESPPIPNILSRDARDFIQKCVQFNPDDRPTASELMEHPFIKTSLSASTSSDVSLHKG